MQTTTITRRAALTSAAALPAISLPAAAQTEDPAIAAVRRWLETQNTERAYA